MHHEADCLSRDPHGATPLAISAGRGGADPFVLVSVRGTAGGHSSFPAPDSAGSEARAGGRSAYPTQDRPYGAGSIFLASPTAQAKCFSTSEDARIPGPGVLFEDELELFPTPHACAERPVTKTATDSCWRWTRGPCPAFATASWTRRFVLAGSSTNLSARGILLCKFYFWGCTSVVFPTAHTCTRPANTTTGWGTGRPSHFASFHGASWSR